jgi:hypothetical protein
MKFKVGDRFHSDAVRSVVTVSSIIHNGEYPDTYFCRYDSGEKMLFTVLSGPSILPKYKRLLEEMIK